MSHSNSHRYLLRRASAVLLIFAVLFIASRPYMGLQGSPAITGVVIPLYSGPETSTWDTVSKAKTSHPTVPIIVVINPSSGPGTAHDSSYEAGVQKLRAVGVIVLGYVATSYASRNLSDVLADVNSYHDWYRVDGVFLDEMPSELGYEDYYASISEHAKSIGLTLTIGNPGTDTPSSYLGTMDVLVMYENEGLPSISYLSAQSARQAKSNFALISYGIGALSRTFVREASRYVGYLYITSESLPNPYNALPGYFLDLVDMLSNPRSATPLSVW